MKPRDRQIAAVFRFGSRLPKNRVALEGEQCWIRRRIAEDVKDSSGMTIPVAQGPVSHEWGPRRARGRPRRTAHAARRALAPCEPPGVTAAAAERLTSRTTPGSRSSPESAMRASASPGVRISGRRKASR